MADKIKGITIEIGGDTTGLSKALKGVNAEIKNTQSNLKDVNKLLKLDPTNTELLKQKQQLLKQAIGETQEKLKTLKDAEKQAQEQFKRGEISQEQYDALKREIIKTENELKNLQKEARNSNAALSKISGVADKIAEGANNVAAKTRALSAAAGGAIAGIATLGYKAATSADDLNTLAKQTGLSTEMLQKAQYATDLIDVSYDTFTSSINKMVGKLRTNEKGFNELGISTRGAGDEMLSTEEIFFNSVEALSHIENETERDIKAQELFGKSAAELAGIIDDGGAALKEYGEQAEEMGLILDQDTLDSLNEVNDKIDTIRANVKGTLAKSGAKALEALTPIIDNVAKALQNALEWVGNLDEGTIKIILTVLAVIAAISPVAKIIAGISAAISFLCANPIVLLLAALAAVAAAIIYAIKHWDKIKAKVQEVVDKIKAKVTEMKDKVVGKFNEVKEGVIDKIETLKQRISDKFEAIKEKIVSPIRAAKETISGFIDDIKGFFSNLKLELPKIKTPHFRISGGEAPWGIGGKGTKPSINIDWYRKAMNNAMVLNKPTIFGYSNGSFLGGGEAGSEVVSGANTLMGMIQSAVANEMNNSPAVQLLQIIANNTGASTSIDINNREFARLVKGVV